MFKFASLKTMRHAVRILLQQVRNFFNKFRTLLVSFSVTAYPRSICVSEKYRPRILFRKPHRDILREPKECFVFVLEFVYKHIIYSYSQSIIFDNRPWPYCLHCKTLIWFFLPLSYFIKHFHIRSLLNEINKRRDKALMA